MNAPLPPPPSAEVSPPPFSEQYYRARRAYGLAGGVLIAWALIGVDVADTPVEGIHLTLKSPSAVPYVLVALVIYFAFRLVIEWYQTPAPRRLMRSSVIDYRVSHGIGVGGLVLYFGQLLLELRLAELLPSPIAANLAALFAVGFLGMSALWSIGVNLARIKARKGDTAAGWVPSLMRGLVVLAFALLILSWVEVPMIAFWIMPLVGAAQAAMLIAATTRLRRMDAQRGDAR